ncbi:MAG: SGNH/GDSL hydrolase family protein [Solirubrobacteraceae bacterium]
MHAPVVRARHAALFILAAAAIAATTSQLVVGSAGAAVTRADAPTGTHWAGTWGASSQPATPSSLLGTGSTDVSAAGFNNQTVRNIVYSSVGGSQVQVRVSNVFSTQPLVVGRVDIAVQRSGARLEPNTNHVLRFGGKNSITIPPGAEAVSDPTTMTVPALTNLAVSIYLPDATGPATYHALAQQTNYISTTGNFAGQASGAAFATTTQSWYYLDDVNVLDPGQAPSTVVALGDSITDGYASQVNANDRWPNFLARRLEAQQSAQPLGVVDEGISGNRILNDSACFGTNALSRLDRDVLTQAGVKDVILLEGINDIGFPQTPDTGCTAPNTSESAAQIIAGYEQIIARVHAAQIKIFGGTLTPFKKAAYWSPAAERKREAVNNWIRTSGAFDGVIDFAAAVANPNDPQMFAPQYDSGDHLHPNDAGYQAMANAVNLAMLEQ